MANEVLLMRENNHLSAAEPWSMEVIEAMKNGEIVTAKITRTRNGKHHRKFFVLIGEVFKNQERYPTMEHLLDAIKIATGHYEMIHITKTKQVYKPKSIAFANMDQAAFEQFYDKVVTLIVTKILPGTNRQDLEDRVMEILGEYA